MVVEKFWSWTCELRKTFVVFSLGEFGRSGRVANKAKCSSKFYLRRSGCFRRLGRLHLLADGPPSESVRFRPTEERNITWSGFISFISAAIKERVSRFRPGEYDPHKCARFVCSSRSQLRVITRIAVGAVRCGPNLTCFESSLARPDDAVVRANECHRPSGPVD